MKQPVKYPYNQSPFYNLQSKRKLSDLLMLEPGEFKELLALTGTYRRAWKHKKENKWLKEEPTGKLAETFRPIDIPADKLKRVQRRIAVLFDRITIPDNVYSPVKGRSYIDNAAAHRAAKSVFSMDIERYFPNTNIKKIIGFFTRIMRCSNDVAVLLAKIVTKDDCLPQGSPCSPILAYHVNHEMWNEITSLCIEAGCFNTIYADDLTISSSMVPANLVHKIRGVVRKHGMSIKREKDKSSYCRPNMITGVIVNQGRLLLPNNKHHELMKAADNLRDAVTLEEKKKAFIKLRSRRSQRDQVERANELK